MNSTSKIIIVDDHSLFREGMKLLIEKEGLGEVIAEAENGQVFLDLLEDFSPELVLMDIEMPVMGGVEATLKAKARFPLLKILVLTMQSENHNYTEMINAGASGFVLKTAGKQELEKAIKTVIDGESYFSNKLLCKIILNFQLKEKISDDLSDKYAGFTERELEILNCFCEGLAVSEIADKLFRSIKTIESHRSKLLQKTNTKNTINLILYAIKNKLVEINV